MARQLHQAPSNASNGSTISLSLSFSSVSESMKTAFPKDEKALLQPLKKVKSCVSTCSKSSTIDQDDASQNPKNNDDALTVSSDQSDLEIVEVNPENELKALKRTWHSPIYSFFKPDGVSIQYHDDRMCHFFPCAARKCKTGFGGVRHYQDSKDKSSTGNLRHHAI
ncbi:hypothetical protein V8E52_011790 [Russula decolorans]